MIDNIKAEIIAKKYYKDIYTYCYSHLNCTKEDADDITQEVFFVFCEKHEELEDINILAWLYKVARNKAHEHLRAQKKNCALLPLEDTGIAVDDNEIINLLNDYCDIDDEEIEKYKSIILKGLTKNEQYLYNSIFIEKKKYKEIAEELNISEKAVNVRALRLRKKIKRMVTLAFTSIGQLIIRLFF